MARKLRFGDRVRLNSGGPVGLVADLVGGGWIVVAWPNGQESSLPIVCFTRATSGDGGTEV